jgi:hypothetical protein
VHRARRRGLAWASDGSGPPLVKTSNWVTHLEYDPAVLAAVLAAGVLSLALLPGDIEQRLARFATTTRAFGRLARSLAKTPDTLGSDVRTARNLVRERRLGPLGAVAY